MKEVIRTTINVGLEKPIKLLHITDVHITKYADNDPDFQKELLDRRVETFRKEGDYPPFTPEEYFVKALDLAKKEGAIPVVTGDVIDIHTKGNVQFFLDLIKGKEILFTPGGHEYQQICKRTMEEGPEYVAGVKAELKEQFPQFEFDFSNYVIGGVNLVFANNSLDYYNEYTVKRFEEELEKGLPIIVFSHNPINDTMLGLTESYHENVALTKEDYEISNRMLKALWQDERVVATVAGHMHRNEEFEAFGKRHYTTDGLFKGICRLIEIV